MIVEKYGRNFSFGKNAPAYPNDAETVYRLGGVATDFDDYEADIVDEYKEKDNEPTS